MAEQLGARLRTPKKDPSNVVYLHTFPPTPHVYNICPFALKLESFFRIHDIAYQMVYTMKFGAKGQIPYIVLNNEEIDDSNVIIPRVMQAFGIVEEISASQKAISLAFTRMIEEHTSQIGFYYRYGLHMREFFDALDIPNRLFDGHNSLKGRMIAALWQYFQPSQTRKKAMYSGLGRHSDAEKWSFSNHDLQAISDILGDKLYFWGEHPTIIDCVVFGHLAQFLFIPMDFPQKIFLHKHCQNVVQFVERFKSTYWKDWNELCSLRVAATEPRITAKDPKSTTHSRNTPMFLFFAGVAAVSTVVAAMVI